MQYLGLAIVVALLALIVLLVALRLLLGGHWFMGWLRGTCGFVVLALAGLIALIGYDISTYTALPPEQKPLVTLTFQAQGAQRYEVTLEQGKETRTVMLEGDLWQLDLNLLRWKSLAELIGLESGYRLERLSGRWVSPGAALRALPCRRAAEPGPAWPRRVGREALGHGYLAVAAAGTARHVPGRGAGIACRLHADCRWRQLCGGACTDRPAGQTVERSGDRSVEELVSVQMTKGSHSGSLFHLAGRIRPDSRHRH